MSDLKQQRNSGKVIEAIVEKLLPWHRIKWLSVGLLSQTVRIRVVGMNVAVSLCSDESLFQVQFLEPATNPEDLYQIQRLEAILNGAKRDDAGNLTCGVDKGIEEPSQTANPSETPNSPKWIPKVGDIVRINSPERVNHGRVGVVVTKRARVCDVASEVSGKWKTWGLTANELQLIGFPE